MGSGGFRLIMNPSIKKLSALFLIGAILTSSLALGVSAFINRASDKEQALRQGNGLTNGLISANGYRIYGAGPNGQNLTDEVANIFARQLVEVNPQGPIQNGDGSVQLFYPTSTELFSYLAANAPSVDILTPDMDDSRIQIVSDFDDSDVSHYFSEMAQVQSDISSDPAWQASLSATTETTDDAATGTNYLPEISGAVVSARDRLYAIEVPAPLVPLHKSLLATFSTMASYFEVAVQDPVGAVALSNDFERILEERIADQDVEAERILKDIQDNSFEIVPVSFQGNRSVLAEMFEVQIAYATAPVIDYAHIAAAIGEWVKQFIEWAKVWAREALHIAWSSFLVTLKNQLVQQLGQKVIEWAEGEGAPGYVTNWLALQVESGLAAKIGLINRETAKVCGNAATAGLYGDILTSALGAAGVQGRPAPVGEAAGCPSANSGFYSKGGYSSEFFLQSLTHNVYNDLLNIRDRSVIAAANASQAAVNEALSGRGLLDVKKCDDGSGVDSEGRCSDGSPARTVTPGSSKQDLISKVLGAAQDAITSTNNENMFAIIGQFLAQAVVNYALQESEGIFSRSGDSPPSFPGGEVEGQLLVSISANPATVAPGASSTLYWVSTNATECSLGITDGTMTPVEPNDSMGTPALTDTTSWTIECTSPDGSATDTVTVSVGGGGGGGGGDGSSIFILTPEERAVFTPPADWCADQGYPSGSMECEWSGTEGGPLKHAWEAFNTGSLPATNSPDGIDQWYELYVGGSQNHALLNLGMSALSWGLQGNVANYETAATNAMRVMELDSIQGHQRHEALGYGDFWTGGIASMALAGMYAPAGSTSGPQLLAVAREWWADHITVIRSIRMADGQVGILGSRQAFPYETGVGDLWGATGSAMTMQLADPISYGQLHPSIKALITEDGKPKRGNYPGLLSNWYRPRGVGMWLVLRALQTGAFLPVPAGHQMPAVNMDVYRWTDGGRTYIATPATCGYPPARWEVSWAPGEVLRVELAAEEFGGDAPDVPGQGGKGPHPAPDSLRIPASANHLFGPAGPETRCVHDS